MTTKENQPQIHHTTKIWHPDKVNIYGNCKIGMYCNIGSFVEIGPGVNIGNKVSIAAFCFIPSGVTIEDGCFIGPRVTFTNDKYPPSHKEQWQPILIKRNASLGAGSIILPGVTIGVGAMIGAGTVVTRDIADGWRVVGNPAKRVIPPVIICEHNEIKVKDDIFARFDSEVIIRLKELCRINGNTEDDLKLALYKIETYQGLWTQADWLDHIVQRMAEGYQLRELTKQI